MNFFRRWIWPHTIRGEVLSLYKEGMACADNHDTKGAMDAYTSAIERSDAPDDVKAMALYNRALLFATEGHIDKALADLKAVMETPLPLRDVQLAAWRRLDRLQHRLAAAIRADRRPTS